MANEIKQIPVVGKVGEVSTSPRIMQKSKPEPAQAASAKLSPVEQKNLDTALYDEARQGKLEEVKRLIKAGANVNAERMPLLWASIEGHIEVVKFLLENGADVNLKCSTGATAIWGAVAQYHLEVVELLIAHGAGVNSRSNEGTSLLEMANEHSIPEISELLQKHGAKE